MLHVRKTVLVNCKLFLKLHRKADGITYKIAHLNLTPVHEKILPVCKTVLVKTVIVHRF